MPELGVLPFGTGLLSGLVIGTTGAGVNGVSTGFVKSVRDRHGYGPIRIGQQQQPLAVVGVPA